MDRGAGSTYRQSPVVQLPWGHVLHVPVVASWSDANLRSDWGLHDSKSIRENGREL
jgi:hypothetical protein